MKKRDKVLIGIIAGICICVALIWWYAWSLATYEKANRYAGDLTKAWQETAEIKTDLAKSEKSREEIIRWYNNLTYRTIKWEGIVAYQNLTKEKIKLAIVNALTKDPGYFHYPSDLDGVSTETIREWAEKEADNMIADFSDGLTSRMEEWEKVATAIVPAVPTAPALTSPAPTAPVVVPVAPVTPTTPTLTPPVAPAPAAAPTASDRLKLATVGKGEGIEHAFIRQLVADPSIVEGVKVKVLGKVYDLTYKGKVEDKKALKKWAGWAADLIAQNQGYVNFATGREIWVKVADKVAYLIDKKDSNVVVGEIVEGKVADTKQSSGDEENPFEGDTSEGVQNYESIHDCGTPTSAQTSGTVAVSSVQIPQISANLFVSGLQIDFVWGTESLC